MNIKALVLLISITYALEACNRGSTEHNNASVSSHNDDRHASISRIDGYKDVKFGMTALELAKTTICADNYEHFKQNSITGYNAHIKRLQTKLDDVDRNYEQEMRRLKSDIENLNYNLAELSKDKQNTAPRPMFESNYMKRSEDDLLEDRQLLSQRIVDRQSAHKTQGPILKDNILSEISAITNEFNQTQSHPAAYASKWFLTVVHNENGWGRQGCSTEIMGTNRNVFFFVSNDRVTGLAIPLGAFDKGVYNALANTLQAKYVLTHMPSNEQIDGMNSNLVNRLAYTYANNQVALAVDASYSRQYNGDRAKYVTLYYFNSNNASEYLKTLNHGVVHAEDL